MYREEVVISDAITRRANLGMELFRGFLSYFSGVPDNDYTTTSHGLLEIWPYMSHKRPENKRPMVKNGPSLRNDFL